VINAEQGKIKIEKKGKKETAQINPSKSDRNTKICEEQ